MDPVSEGQRYTFPPLWLVPLLLILAIGLAFYASMALGVLGFIAGLFGIVWLERKADAYVRSRERSDD